MEKNIEWFKKELSSNMVGFDLNYRFFEQGDFGFLNQIEFNSKKLGGNIDFWELGWIGIFVWNYEKEEQILNILLEPSQEKEITDAFNTFQNLLG
jgi:hypothetical protein